MVLVALRRLGGQLLGLLLEQLERVRLVDLLATSGRDAVADPLPQLTAADLSGGGILHQVVDGDAANAAEPSLHVSETDVQVLADTLLGDLAGNVHVEQVVGGDLDILTANEVLVGGWHVLVEDLGCDGCEGWVGNPGSVVAGLDLAELVGVDTLHGLVVGGLVVLDGDLGSHSSHGGNLALVAGLDEELDVGVHEWDGHGDGGPVGEDEVGVLAELLDHAEDVIPASAVKSGAVIPQLKDDLVHLEGGQDGLDKNGTTDGASWHANLVLSKVEDVVPKTGLEVRLQLWKVEVWSMATLDELLGVVEEVKTEVEEGSGDRLAVNGEVLLLQVPSSRPDNQSW